MPSGYPLPDHPYSLELFSQNENYHASFLIKPDEALEGALARQQQAGLPDIEVSPSMGKLLYLFAKSINAKRILEVGTLGGYSTIWLAKAIPEDGKIVTLEMLEEHAEIARKNFEAAGVASKIKVIVGVAAETLKTLEPPFDFAFIDADKQSNTVYFQEAERLVRPGGVIILDNAVRAGRVALPDHYTDPDSEGVRNALRYIQSSPNVEAVTNSTASLKGWDGFIYAYRK